MTKSKNSALRIAEFTTLKFLTFKDFFHFLGLNWSLKECKCFHIIQTQFNSSNNFRNLVAFATNVIQKKPAFKNLQSSGLRTSWQNLPLFQIPKNLRTCLQLNYVKKFRRILTLRLQICITKNTVPNCNCMPIKTVSITVISTTKIGLYKVQIDCNCLHGPCKTALCIVYF